MTDAILSPSSGVELMLPVQRVSGRCHHFGHMGTSIIFCSPSLVLDVVMGPVACPAVILLGELWHLSWCVSDNWIHRRCPRGKRKVTAC